jgi:drug/metabolite transporter (DMT)-like permease
MNTFLYTLTVLIWGSTWIAIKWQLGVVPAPVSIAYRFWIAAVVLLLVLAAMRKPVMPPARAWRYLLAQGVRCSAATSSVSITPASGSRADWWPWCSPPHPCGMRSTEGCSSAGRCSRR